MMIILGSQSASRKQVLSEMGYEFEIMAANIDEKKIRNSDPKKLVLALARAKSDTLLKQVTEPAIIITGDQVVLWKNTILEKPIHVEQAREFLRSYAQAPAECVNGIVVVNTANGKRAQANEVTKVYFKEIPDRVIEQFIQEGNALSRAGGFGGEHPLLVPYIERIEGSVDSMMGLPKQLTQQLIHQVQ